MRLLPCGDQAILVEFDTHGERRALDAALRRGAPEHVVDHVPAEFTVLVRVASPERLQAVADALRAIDLGDAGVPPDGQLVTIDTWYDGADLGHVADRLGITTTEVVARHTGQLWTVEFMGFTPGFGYLVGDHGGLDVERRSSPRAVVPAGAVALAAGYSGVYPRPSPGGWQLIGRTARQLWNPAADHPALLRPGTSVRFVKVTA